MRRKRREAALVHRTIVRVRFSETDAMRVVWHGEYIRYMEDGREAFGAAYGIGYLDFFRHRVAAPIVEVGCRYLAPLTAGDEAEVETRFITQETASIVFEYSIRRVRDGVLVAEGESRQVFTNEAGELLLEAPEWFEAWKAAHLR